MTNKAQDDKNMKILRQLSNEPDNKKCMDCGIKGTVYVCSNFNTFICTACSGLHREFNHRVKSISMTTFKPEEIKNLQQGGNAAARKKWLAKWSQQDFPEPDPSDAARVKAFMKLKYIDKRWYSESGEGPQAYQGSHNVHQAPPAAKPKIAEYYPPPEPLSKILGNDIPPIQINGSHKQPTAPAPVSPPPSSSQAGNPLVDWNAKTTKPVSAASDLDELLSLPSPQQQAQYQQQLHQHQQQLQYQQQQQLVMSQFNSQGAWGAQPPYGFSPYGAQPGFNQQPQGFFGVQQQQQPPPNFFAQPPPQSQQAPGGGAVSPTFGQPFGGAPSPTPLSQPFGGPALSPAQPSTGFGASPAQPSPAFGGPALSPAQPSAGFGASPAQPSPAFGGTATSPVFGGPAASPAFGGVSPSLHSASPSLHSASPSLHSGFGAPTGSFSLNPQQPQAPQQPQQPPADKFDIFASLSPLSAATASNAGSVSKPYNPPHPAATSTPSTSHNPNPFGDPFGGLNPTPATSHPQHSQQQAQSLGSDPFGFGGAPSPSLQSKPSPASAASSDPFGFGSAPTVSQPQQSANNSNSFANPFGAAPPPAAQQPPSAFSPFSANPFGQQQQQQQQQPQQQQQAADPWGNPFNF